MSEEILIIDYVTMSEEILIIECTNHPKYYVLLGSIMGQSEILVTTSIYISSN